MTDKQKMLVKYRKITQPNNSLTVVQRIKLFCVLSIMPLLIATAFALVGIWLVLPFTGIELIALAYAFYFVSLHADDYESITIIDESRLTIETRSNKQLSCTELNPCWVNVVLDKALNGNISLRLRSHGKSIEIGRYMDNDSRIEFAKQLKFELANLHTTK